MDGRQGGDDAGRTRDLWLLELLDEDLGEEETYCRHYEVLADHVGYLSRCSGVIRSCRGEKGCKQSRESMAEHWRRASTEPRLFRCSALAATSRVVEAIAHLVRPMRAHSTESNTMAITAPFLIGYHNQLAVHMRSCRLR